MILLLLFLALILLLLAGFPVAFTLGGVSLLFALFTPEQWQVFDLLPARVWGNVMRNEILIAVPLFVYMGVMLERSGLAEKLLETMALLFGRIRGGLALSVIAVGALLAASTGIVGATVVTMGLLSLPTMMKRGYSKSLACGTIAAAGTLGQIIPPSVILILLASVIQSTGGHHGNPDALQADTGTLFRAAVIPGLLLVTAYALWVGLVALCRPRLAPAMPPAEVAAFRGWRMVRGVTGALLPPLVLVLAVLGSIFFGIATATESAAVGALGATLLTALHRRLSRETLRAVMRETTLLTSMVFVILIGANAFSLVFRALHGDTYLVHLVERTNLGPTGFLLLVMLVMFIAGFFIDFIEIVFILVPVTMPVFHRLGVDPVWLAILMAVNLQTSFITPPFGFSLFYLKGVAPPEITTLHIYRGVIPYIVLQLGILALLFAFPDLVTWLPRKLELWLPLLETWWQR